MYVNLVTKSCVSSSVCKKLLTTTLRQIRCISHGWSQPDDCSRSNNSGFTRPHSSIRSRGYCQVLCQSQVAGSLNWRLQYLSKKKKLMSATVKINPQEFDYFLVLDFEATCEKNAPVTPQEIIEFPCLKVSGLTFEVESQFHQYVQPRVHKQLTPFCTELTGIAQSMVSDEPHIEETLEKFDAWMKSEGLLEKKFVFVTCGDWDLKVMLKTQCQHFSIPYPSNMKSWINIKKPFFEVTRTYPKGIMHMLKILNMTHQGRLHSGIDDCINIAHILKTLAETGYIFKTTGQNQ